MSCDWSVGGQACLGLVGNVCGGLLKLWKKGSFAGEMLSPSILGALTVLIIGPPDGLLGKEVEGMCPRIVLQFNLRVRENNSNAYA